MIVQLCEQLRISYSLKVTNNRRMARIRGVGAKRRGNFKVILRMRWVRYKESFHLRIVEELYKKMECSSRQWKWIEVSRSRRYQLPTYSHAFIQESPNWSFLYYTIHAHKLIQRRFVLCTQLGFYWQTCLYVRAVHTSVKIGKVLITSQ